LWDGVIAPKRAGARRGGRLRGIVSFSDATARYGGKGGAAPLRANGPITSP